MRDPNWRWQLLHLFSVKLVLEVFGGGGAIWGFSEACGLRHENNIWFGRPAALSIAFLFALRWAWQLSRAIALSQRKQQQQQQRQVMAGKDAAAQPISALSPISGIQLSAFQDDLMLEDDEEKELLSSEATALTKNSMSPPSSKKISSTR
ncbi:MAG: hypothetical protein SGARI_007892 [Bacillariaceae sp.]